MKELRMKLAIARFEGYLRERGFPEDLIKIAVDNAPGDTDVDDVSDGADSMGDGAPELLEKKRKTRKYTIGKGKSRPPDMEKEAVLGKLLSGAGRLALRGDKATGRRAGSLALRGAQSAGRGARGVGTFFRDITLGGAPRDVIKNVKNLPRHMRQAPGRAKKLITGQYGRGKQIGYATELGIAGGLGYALDEPRKQQEGFAESIGRRAGQLGELGAFLIPGAQPAATLLTTGSIAASAITGKDVSLSGAGAAIGRGLDKIFGSGPKREREVALSGKKDRPKSKKREGQKYEMRSDKNVR